MSRNAGSTGILQKNKRGSRIVITTRNVEVGSVVKESSIHYVHNLQALPLESSQELFCKKAFQGFCCPPELEKISLDVKRCEGLSLAIVTMGGALSTKEKNALEWQKFNDSLGSQLAMTYIRSIWTSPHMYLLQIAIL